MKIWFRISDDLGLKHDHLGVVESEGSWKALQELCAKPELQARFGSGPNVCLNVEIMPFERREGAAEKA